MEGVMKLKFILPSIVMLCGPTQSHAEGVSGQLSGYQCVGLNIKELRLSQDDLRTGNGFPWMLAAPRLGANPVARVSSIIYVAWPLTVENGFVKTLTYGGRTAWVEQNAISALRRSDGTTGGCALSRRSDGRIMFHLDPGVGVNNE